VLGNSHKSQLQPIAKNSTANILLNTKDIKIRDKFKKKQTKRNAVKYAT
jgi:hypothetical protein